MRSFLFLFFLLLTSLSANAHEYFFGFAELTYNEADAKYEGTLILSTHDLEDWLKKRGVTLTELEFQQFDEDLFSQMEIELFKGFKLSQNGREMKLHGLGFETDNTGTTQIYFQSEKTTKSAKIDVTFDILMDVYPKQQNKITYRDAEFSVTTIFLFNKPTSSISIQ